MSRIIDNYSFDSITPYESIIDFPRPTSHIFPETSSNQSIAILPSINEPTPAQIEHTFWRPSDALLKVLRILHEIDYTQFPCIPCRAHTAHVCYTLIRSSGSLAKQITSSHLNTYILIFP